MLHTIIREFLVDEIGDIQNPIGMTGSRLEVSTLIVESFAPHFDALTRVLSQAGIQVTSVIFGPLASARAVLSKQQKELGVLMIDFGGGTTSVAVFDEAKPLYAKTFPVGSGHITNDIAIGLKLQVETAEKIKIQSGTALSKSVNRKEMISMPEEADLKEVSRRLLAEIIEDRVAEILGIVHNELKPLKNRFQFPAGVVATGAGIHLRGITEAIREDLKLSVQIGSPDLGQFDIENAAHEELLRDPEFSAAVGLVLVGSDDVERKSISAAGWTRRFLRNLIP
jgi:cell division protein FtsA